MVDGNSNLSVLSGQCESNHRNAVMFIPPTKCFAVCSGLFSDYDAQWDTGEGHKVANIVSRLRTVTSTWNC